MDILQAVAGGAHAAVLPRIQTPGPFVQEGMEEAGAVLGAILQVLLEQTECRPLAAAEAGGETMLWAGMGGLVLC